MFIGSALFALQQLSGINAVFYFSSATFESFGVSSKIGNTCVGICNLLGNCRWLNSFVFFSRLICKLLYICLNFVVYATSGSVISMILMDKLGRKVLLLGSFLGMVRKKNENNNFSELIILNLKVTCINFIRHVIKFKLDCSRVCFLSNYIIRLLLIFLYRQ